MTQLGKDSHFLGHCREIQGLAGWLQEMTRPFPSNWMMWDFIDLMAKGFADKGFGTSRGRNLNDDLEDNAAQS